MNLNTNTVIPNIGGALKDRKAVEAMLVFSDLWPGDRFESNGEFWTMISGEELSNITPLIC